MHTTIHKRTISLSPPVSCRPRRTPTLQTMRRISARSETSLDTSSHGFDDEGRQFDADGNLRDWWQKKDEEAFNKLADCIVKEYSSFEPLPGVHLNGKLTLGENTADNGGLRLAYMALMDSLAKHTNAKDKQED